MRKHKRILALLLCCTMLGTTQTEITEAATAYTTQADAAKISTQRNDADNSSVETDSLAMLATEQQLTEQQSTEQLAAVSETETEEIPATEETIVTESPVTELPVDTELTLLQPTEEEATGALYIGIDFDDDENGDWISMKSGSDYQMPEPDIRISAEDGEQNTPTKEQVRAGLTYTSSDPTVLTVTGAGKLHAVAARATEGTSCVTIKATYVDTYGDSYIGYFNVDVYNTIALSEDDVTIYVQQSKKTTLTATTCPAGAAVTWSSSDESIVKVDSKGQLIAQKTGSALVTATAGGVSASCYVTVASPSLTMPETMTLYVGNKTTLGAEITPKATIKWTSSNKKVATVNSKGVITPKKTGKVTIKAKALGITKKCVVRVEKPSVTMYDSSISIFKGSSYQMNAYANPSYALKWKSSNKKVATVDKNGVVQAKKSGTTTITAYVSGAKATCTVKIVKNSYSLNTSLRTIMEGSTASIYVKKLPDTANVTYNIDGDWGIASVSSKNGVATVKALQKGTVTLTASARVYVDGAYVYWGDTCKIKVIDSGIKEQQVAVAKGKTKQLHVKTGDDAKKTASVSWTSSKTSVASVDHATGLLKAKKSGTTKVTAKVAYTDGTTASYTSSIYVSDAKAKTSSLVVTRYNSKTITLKGVSSYSTIKWKSSRKSVAKVSGNGVVTGVKTGSATITVTVDGKKITCKVYVSNPTLQGDYSGLAPGSTAQIQLNGVTKKSKITYESGNRGVVTVSDSGIITAVGCGSVDITITADGKKLYYWVEVAPQAAWNACNNGYSIINRSTYSQAYRMTEGYYDCSALVFRAYGRNVALLGGSTSWAPTAAGMATYMVQTGKVIAYQSLPVTQLLPGDLIFYGNEANGRYLGIYHVSMYYGGGNRLEKPLRTYYEDSNIVMIARPVR